MFHAEGDGWLMPTWMGPIILLTIPTSGIQAFSGAIPGSLDVPVTLCMQAVVGPPLQLSALCTRRIE